MAELDERLLGLLACPACDERPPVRLVGDELLCDACGRAYPIADGIPDMLVGDARLTRGEAANE